MNWLDLLNAPPVEWEARTAELTPSRKQDLEQELSALIQRAALLQTYVAHRWNTGCGDQGHARSAKAAHSVLVRIRKALGFSYPANTPSRVP